ncbi:hypothetical protein MBLNU457_2331t1 [Dothideomycetes sp. NU457]
MATVASQQDTTDQGWKILVVEWTLLSISTTVVLLRFFVRGFIEDDRFLKRVKFRRLQVEDYLMALAVFAQYGHAIAIALGVEKGLGRHIWTLEDATIGHIGHIIQVVKGFSIVPSCLARISIALYQLRLLPPKSSWLTLSPLMVVIVFDPIVNLVTLIQIYAQCGTHLSALWDPAEAAVANCESPFIETRIGYAQSGINSLCDLILSVFPIVILWALQMPTRRKLQLYAVLSTSYLALIASIIKTVRIGELSASPDFTWNFVNLQIWVAVEVNTIIITGSCPCLFPLVRLWFKKRAHIYSGSERPFNYFSASKNSAKTARSIDSQELSIVKRQEFHVSIDEGTEEEVQNAIPGRHYTP